MKLISMIDFIQWLEDNIDLEIWLQPRDFIRLAKSYKNFLKQPLELWMFEKDGLFICENWKGALLIDGHNVIAILHNLKTVEELLFMEPVLTDKAQKMIGL